MHSKKNNAKTGFSTVETVMVLAVSLILAGFAAPSIRSVLNSYHLRAAVSSATGAIQSTRYQALREGYPYQVTFSGGSGGINPTYQVASKPAGATTFTNIDSAVPVSGSAITLSSTTVLQFKPNGSVTATTGGLSFSITYLGATETITVTNYGNITVAP
jgi:Tfp pilus assembly protein FimT